MRWRIRDNNKPFIKWEKFCSSKALMELFFAFYEEQFISNKFHNSLIYGSNYCLLFFDFLKC